MKKSFNFHGFGFRQGKGKTPLRKFFPILLIAFLAIILSGCQTIKFYGQAIRGQCQILAREEPINELLRDTNTPPALKQRLELVLELRQFAEKELKLKIDGQYAEYADLHRRFVVWDVYAAPEFSLKAKSWWYPFVGSLDYRGYFSEKGARQYADRLWQKNYDVYVSGVEAYSTLGWFKDPVLNTFIWNQNADLAETLFHELAHQRVFVGGDTEFNEAFATAVSQEGVRRWLRARHDPAAWERYQLEVDRDKQFVHLVLGARRKLAALYAGFSATNSPPSARERPQTIQLERQQKARIIEQLRRDYQQLKAGWGGYSGYDKWFDGPLNNAQLNTVSTYDELAPAFLYLLHMDHGDFAKFFQDARLLTKLSKPERHKKLEELLEAARQLPQEEVANAASEQN